MKRALILLLFHQVAKEHCIAMVQSKVLKQLSILEQRRSDDEDIVADVEYLTEKLQASIQDLSSFDEYATEVKSGRLVGRHLKKQLKLNTKYCHSVSDWNGRLFISRPNFGERTLLVLMKRIMNCYAF